MTIQDITFLIILIATGCVPAVVDHDWGYGEKAHRGGRHGQKRAPETLAAFPRLALNRGLKSEPNVR